LPIISFDFQAMVLTTCAIPDTLIHTRNTRRVYADTSVYGGCLDVEFEGPSKLFFARVREGLFRLVISETVI
jgi:hypothetical protein